MKKHLSLLLAILLALSCFSLAGCHGGKAKRDFEMPESFDTSREYNITFWAKNDSNKVQVAIYDQAVADFEKLYPNIHVTLKRYSDYVTLKNDVITNIATDTTPNVCITYPDHIANYLAGDNVVVALDDLFANSKYGFGGSELKYDAPARDEIVSEFLNECIVNGKYYAIPYMRSTEALYVNKTMLESMGYSLPEKLTWDFIWEVSEKAMEKDSSGNFTVNGQKVMIPFIYKSTDNMMITMLKQLNAPYSDSKGNIGIFSEETTNILKEVNAHAKTRAFSTFKVSSYPGNFLNAGQCIFAIDSTAGSTWIGSQAPLIDISKENLVEFETAVVPIPQYNPNDPKMISQGPSICIFNKEDPQEVLASWIFAQYMLTNDVQIGFSETEGYVPVTRKAQSDPAYLDYLSREGEDNDRYYAVKIQAAKLLLANTSHTFVTPVFNGSASLREAAGDLIENAVKSARRSKSFDDAAISTLYSETKSLYHLDQIVITSNSGEKNLGPLPGTSVILISAVVLTWIGILIYVAYERVKKKSKNNK